MVSEDSPGYFLVSEANQRRSQSQRQSACSYDLVGPPQGPRPHQPSIYEVPPLSSRGRGNGQEGEDTPSLAPSRSSRVRSDVYENTNIGTQQQVTQPPPRDSSYDLVTLPPRKATLDQPSYDTVPPPTRVSQEQRSSSPDQDSYQVVPPPTRVSQEPRSSTLNQPSYDTVPPPSRVSPEQRSSTLPSSSSATDPRTQGDMPCPLDMQGYEFVRLRKPDSLPRDFAPEMQPFAPAAGYMPMGPPTDAGYEILAPPAEIQEHLANRGDYETLAMVGPQRTGSQTGSVQIAQQPTGSMNIPVSAPLYERPPVMSSPVYEIAPPPRNVLPVSWLHS